MANKLTSSIYKSIKKCAYIYHKFKTKGWYGIFLDSCGTGNVIINPILFTPQFIQLKNNVLIRNNSRIEGVSKYLEARFVPLLIIEDGVSIEQNLHLTFAGNISIGKNTALASNVTISDIIHPYDDISVAVEKQPIKVNPVFIAEHCKIYNNAVILPGTHLGKHCVIGANTIVTGKTYPDYSVIVGNPSKIIKRYCIKNNKWVNTTPDGEFIN